MGIQAALFRVYESEREGEELRRKEKSLVVVFCFFFSSLLWLEPELH